MTISNLNISSHKQCNISPLQPGFESAEPSASSSSVPRSSYSRALSRSHASLAESRPVTSTPHTWPRKQICASATSAKVRGRLHLCRPVSAARNSTLVHYPAHMPKLRVKVSHAGPGPSLRVDIGAQASFADAALQIFQAVGEQPGTDAWLSLDKQVSTHCIQ